MWLGLWTLSTLKSEEMYCDISKGVRGAEEIAECVWELLHYF